MKRDAPLQKIHLKLSKSKPPMGKTGIKFKGKSLSDELLTWDGLSITEEDMNTLDSFEFNLNKLNIPFYLVKGHENNLIFLSDKAQDLLGVSAKKIPIDSLKTIIHHEDVKKVLKKRSTLRPTIRITITYRIITQEGIVKWVKNSIMAISNNKGQTIGTIGFLEEITEIKKLQDRLERVTFHDRLTNLPNLYFARKYLKNLIEEYQSTKKSFALFNINLDDFSRHSDTLGFKVGDEITKRISIRISDLMKDVGLPFRIHGDEWGVVIRPQKGEEDISKFAEELLDVIRKPLKIDDYVLHVTACIGVSIFPNDGTNKEELFKNAHTALKCAKQIGYGNYQLYSSEMNIEGFKLIRLEQDLGKAIQNNELDIEYQPKINVETQKATNAEALIRWHHPEWGNISPAEFIPIAEKMGVYQQITDFVIQSVCRQVGEWERKGIPFNSVSFNLSAKDFYRDTLVEQLKDAITKYNVSPLHLEIELTENALLQNTRFVQNQFDQLQKMGIQFALDDFGTGYSSIHYLKEIPVNTVKIDRSFIHHLPQKKEDFIIVKSIIELLKGLNKRVVAEGVETEQQYKILKQLGCSMIQGFFYSPSLSPIEMEKWFEMEKTKPIVKNHEKAHNRRKYFRIKLQLALSAEMTIISFNNKKVSLGSTEVMILDIGPGGLRFMSHLRLTPQDNIIYRFETEFMGSKLQLTGKIVWCQEKDEGIFAYGVSFTIIEQERDQLAGLLNQLAIRLRKDPLFQDGKFTNKNPVAYLNQSYLEK